MIKIRFNSPVIIAFATLCLIVLLLDKLTAGSSTSQFFCVYKSSISVPWAIRLFGHVFGHADWSHYINNMMMLLLVGPMLEEKYGSKVMIETMAITALVTGLVQVVFFSGALLGASGIVFMMIVLSSVTSVNKGEIPVTLILVVILYLGQQIIQGVFTTDNISQLTHIIGGILGGVFGIALKPGKSRR